MAISAPGVGSNLDVSSIVSQLMTIEQRPRLLLDAKEAAYQAQLSAYGQLRGALSALESAVGGLADPARFEGRSASVGDSAVLSASAGAAAANATYEVAVTQLAQRQSLTTAGQASVTAPVGSGASTALTFDFGTISGGTLNAGVYTGASFTQNGSIATRTVTIDASNNSLQGIRDAINAANVGVNASILNVGGTNPYRLVLQSAPGGSAASLRIGVSGDAALAGLLAYDPAGGQSLTQTVAAQDANLTVNGLAVTSGSNILTDAIQGVTLTLAKVGSTTVTVGRDSAAAQTAAQGFVKAYNDLNTLLHDLTRFDAEKDGSGALVGDSAARTIQSQLRSALSSALAGGNSNTLRVLSQVGMSFQKDGSLALDGGKLSQALASDPAGVARLFASGGAASDSLVKVAGSSSGTVPGSYGVEISQLATRGQLVGSTAAALTITAGVNDVLTVTVDGTSATLTLPAGTYTASALAAQLQSLANASSSLRTANAQVTLSEAAGVFTLTSKRYGSGSTLSVGGSAAATLFGGAPTATPGVDVAGTIGGFSATGSGQRLTAAAGSPITGLVLDITGGSTGSRGTVSFARGYAARLEGLLQGVLGTDGAIASRTTGINATIKDLDRQRDVLDRRLAQIEARYRKQFTALDTLMSSMTATSTFLTQQLQQLQRLQSSSG
jgi:flagellar hook-associated protein 2